MKRILRHHRPFTLWLGMYAITTCLFWFETGSVAKGASLGLLSATLKTVWGLLHGRWFGKGDCDKCRSVVIAEGLEVQS
jgi:hypothetical protein